MEYFIVFVMAISFYQTTVPPDKGCIVCIDFFLTHLLHQSLIELFNTKITQRRLGFGVILLWLCSPKISRSLSLWSHVNCTSSPHNEHLSHFTRGYVHITSMCFMILNDDRVINLLPSLGFSLRMACIDNFSLWLDSSRWLSILQVEIIPKNMFSLRRKVRLHSTYYLTSRTNSDPVSCQAKVKDFSKMDKSKNVNVPTWVWTVNLTHSSTHSPILLSSPPSCIQLHGSPITKQKLQKENVRSIPSDIQDTLFGRNPSCWSGRCTCQATQSSGKPITDSAGGSLAAFNGPA